MLISRKGNFRKLYVELPFITHECLSGSDSMLCVVRKTTLVPGELLIGKSLDTRHHFLTGVCKMII